jgi:hypothetical protein
MEERKIAMKKEKTYDERKEDLATGYMARNHLVVGKDKIKYDGRRKMIFLSFLF